MNNLQRIMAIIVGLAISAGAACAWHFWHVDGFLAFLVVMGGLSVVGAGIGCEI